MENKTIIDLEISEKQPPVKPIIFILSWVFAALVSTSISYLFEPFLGQYHYLEIILKSAVIALTQALVLRNYFKKAWYWALLTFAAYLITGLAIYLLRYQLTSIYSGMSVNQSYIFLFGFDILIQSIIASIQYIALKKEVAYASRWIVVSIFSVFLGLISQILVINLIVMYGSPAVFGEYLKIINLSINILVTYLITGIGMVYLLENKLNDLEINEEMLVEELEE